MPYNIKLADRIREQLVNEKNVEEKLMFGGIVFMINEKMAIGVSKEKLMVRFNPDITEEVMQQKGAIPMDFTKKAMKGFVFVEEVGYKSKKDLNYWIGIALAYNKIAPMAKKTKKN